MDKLEREVERLRAVEAEVTKHNNKYTVGILSFLLHIYQPTKILVHRAGCDIVGGAGAEQAARGGGGGGQAGAAAGSDQHTISLCDHITI